MSSITVVKNGSEHMEPMHTEVGLFILVHIRSYQDCVPRGTFITLPDRKKYEFCGLDQMLLIMEDLMDSGQDAESGHRCLYQTPYIFWKQENSQTASVSGNAAGLLGEKVTFTIQVVYRRHTSMQGILTVRVDRKQESIAFRSSLELIRMLHEYLSREMREDEGRTGN